MRHNSNSSFDSAASASESGHHQWRGGPTLDLRARAESAARDAGFETQFSAQAQSQAQDLGEIPPAAGDVAVSSAAIVDLRDLLWSSIDNDESRDLDQVEFCRRLENGRISVRVGIADVASTVAKNSPIDAHAALNTASIYAGAAIFPMLPEHLSTDLTSLLPDVDRLAFVVEMIVDGHGAIVDSTLYRARLRNRAKLVYESIGSWLEGSAALPLEVSRVPGLEEQLRLQQEVAERLLEARKRGGALDVEMPEARPTVVDGRVTGIAVPRKNPARLIIENFMVSANMVMAQFLQGRGIAAIGRVVREPQRWPRIVEVARQYGATLPAAPDGVALSRFLSAQHASALQEGHPERFGELSLSVVKLLGRGEYVVVRGPQDAAGHFGLGMHNYAHSTAPNRRFVDLTTQRIAFSALSSAALPYSIEELETIAAHCSEREAAAQNVERLMRKIAAAVFLGESIGQIFDAVVTGASPKGVYVRTLGTPFEGRVMRGQNDLDVGDKLRVRLTHTDAERGFIDFERI